MIIHLNQFHIFIQGLFSNLISLLHACNNKSDSNIDINIDWFQAISV